ncbi:MAG TPA: vitamin B12 dependent methionine synthase [bacterium]|nr:vitamin B12 dependent methionine synthase [bacterium]
MPKTDYIVLDTIPFSLSAEELGNWARIAGQGGDVDELAGFLEEARAKARPKACYKISYIDEKGDDYVVVEGTRFTSRVLRVNLEEAQRVFPFVATCGTELEEWSNGLDDVMRKSWAGVVKGLALKAAKDFFEARIRDEHPGRTAMMNPGSLADWPIEQQRQLFALLDGAGAAIGVRLLDNFFMSPGMTVSGLRFPLTRSFESCQLCPREACPGRRAAYDRGLYDRRYVEESSK